ncbi:MAG: hypothetical protein HY863_02385 [Chloroflexi bacterium]|nr:hypothetical protein [Chloroflexota bacterium]
MKTKDSPTTGRFLNRDAKPNNSNPYVPFDPMGALFAPLGILAMFYSRRKKGSKWGMWIALLLVVGIVGMGLTACKINNTTGQEVTFTVTQPQGSPTAIVTWQTATATGTATFTPLATLTPCIPTATLPSPGDNGHPYGGNAIMVMYQKMLEYPAGWWFKHPDQIKYKFDFELFG